MRSALKVAAAVAVVVGMAAPAWADDPPEGHYRKHERYQGDYYNYDKYRDTPRSEPGPYDSHYDCQHAPHGSTHHTETWCDHYWAEQQERNG
jgi:hypothetical protein